MKRLFLLFIGFSIINSCTVAGEEEEKVIYLGIYLLPECGNGIVGRTTYCVSQEVFDSLKIVVGTSCEDRFVQFIDVFGLNRSGHLHGKNLSGVSPENCGRVSG